MILNYECSACGHQSADAAQNCPSCRTRFINYTDMKLREKAERLSGLFPILGIFIGVLLAPSLGFEKHIAAFAGIIITPMLGYPLTRFALMKIYGR